MTQEQSRRHHISKGLRDAVELGLISNYHVRDLAYAHCYEAKIKPPFHFYGDTNVSNLCAVLAGTFGGLIEDPDGYAAMNLNRALKHPMTTSGFNSTMLKDAVAQGLVTKRMHTGGRRTDEIRITTKGLKLIGPAPWHPVEFWLPGYEPGGKFNRRRQAKPIGAVAAAVPAPEPEPVVQETLVYVNESDDTLALQRLVLRLNREKTDAQHNIDELVQRLIVADAEIQRLKTLVREAEVVYTDGRDLRDRLSPAEIAELDALMRELPSG